MDNIRRDLLKKASALGFIGTAGMAGLTACGNSSPDSVASARSVDVDLSLKGDWDYPVADNLLPFGHGVQSGDPLQDRVVIWTRISIPDPRGWLVEAPQGITEVPVSWVMATDPSLNNVVVRGDTVTNHAADWTVKIDVDGLDAATTYWFAFAALGFTSIVGRTRTAPSANTQTTELRIAAVSCASYWKGWFNAYGRIADLNDLDLLIHTGDHLYTQASGNNGLVRLAPGTEDDLHTYEHIDNANWTESIAHCKRRYALIGSDPDVVRAHASVPLFVIPDDNDTHGRDSRRNKFENAGLSHADAAEVFWLWRAARPVLADGSGQMITAPGHNVNLNLNPPKGEHARLMYKDLPYGRLAHFASIDIRRNSEGEERANEAVFSDKHWAMMKRVAQTVTANQTIWAVWANQTLMGQIGAYQDDVSDTAASFGLTGWDEESRLRFYGILRDAGANANVVLTGNSHSWVIGELIENNEAPDYIQGVAGSPLGVEMMAGCISSGTLQRNLAQEGYSQANGGDPHMDSAYWDTYMPGAESAAISAENAITAATPNMPYFQSRSEGFGLVHLTESEATLELWEVPVDTRNNSKTLFAQFTMQPGVNTVQQVAVPTETTGERDDAGIDNPPQPSSGIA